MLLLEATEFMEKVLEEPQGFSRLDDIFESAPSTPVNNKSQNARSPSLEDRFQTPYFFIDNNMFKSSSPIDNRSIQVSQFKKTHAFLVDRDKGLGFYDVMFLKLDKNLCLTLIKSNFLSRHCQLIYEFDNVLQGFLDLINRLVDL